MTTRPVRLDRTMAGLRALALALTPAGTVCRWSHGEYPGELDGSVLVTFRLLSGPFTAGLGEASGGPVTLPLTATLTITADTEGADAVLRVSGRRFKYRAQSGDDVEAIRDGLLAAIGDPDDDALVSATFTASGTDQITIAALEPGDLYDLTAYGLASLVVDTSAAIKCSTDDVMTVIDMQVFSRSRFPMDGAAAIMSKLIAAIDLPTARGIMDAYGIDVSFGRPVALDGLAGPRYVSRQSSTIQVTQVSLIAEASTPVETVESTITVRDAPGEATTQLVVESS